VEGIWIRILTNNQDSIVLRSMLKSPKQPLPFRCDSFFGKSRQNLIQNPSLLIEEGLPGRVDGIEHELIVKVRR